MATNILMPALSPTMTDGTLARWLVKEGDQVKAGDVIAEIETDKATMEVEAVDEGVLSRILVPDGTSGVKVNEPIALLQGEGDTDAAPPPAASPPAAKAGELTPENAGTPAEAPRAAAPAPMANGHDAGRVFASPLARRIAKQAGIELSSLRGSGPNGRIVRADVEAAAKPDAKLGAKPEASASKAVEAGAGGRETDAVQAVPVATKDAAPKPEPAKKAPAPAPITAPHTAVPNSNMRRVIARRMAESARQVPSFYLSMDMEIDALLKLRAELNAKSPKSGPGTFKLSVNDLVLKAVAATMRRVPGVNASYTEDAVLLYDDVDISIAVSIPSGLITPIIRQADRKGLAAISNETKALAARAAAGGLKPEEFQGGSFSVSNLGMFGVRNFTAIVNPPQSAILAVGAGEQRPVVRDGQLAVATVMTCTITCDHRVIDGALAAEWMAAFKAIIEDPLSLML